MHAKSKHWLLVLAIFPALTAAVAKVESGCVLAPLPGTNSSIGLLTLRNDSAHRVEFTRAISDSAQRTEFHHMTMQNDVMYMQRIDKLQLAAGRRLKLGMNGTHVMLMDLTRPLKPNQYAELTFFTDKGDGLKVRLPVIARQNAEECELPLVEQPVLNRTDVVDAKRAPGDR